ncbi:MAG: PilZ domain-containing protein [Bdellovibrionota bacterium]
MTKKSTDDENKPQFFEIKEKPMIHKIFDVLVRHNIPVTLWLKNQTLRFETTFVKLNADLKNLTTGIPGDVGEARLTASIKAQGNEEILGSFQVDAVNFFFKSKYIAGNDLAYFAVALPEQLYKLQRRQNLRIPFARERAPVLTMADPTKDYGPSKAISEEDLLSFRVLDLSAGGVAIAAEMDHKDKFKRGLKLADLRFTLKDAQIIASGVVAYASEKKNEKGHAYIKVGVKFNPLKAQYDRQIVQFVLDESRRVFSLLY